jgi:hypothetical protein
MADDELRFEPEPFDEQPPKTQPAKAIPRAKAKTTTTPPYREGVLVEPIAMAYGFFGMGYGVFEFNTLGKEHMPVGMAFTENAETCAIAWDKAAKTNPTLRRVLYKLVGSSNVIALALAHAPIAAAIANEVPATQRLVKGLTTFVERMTNRGQTTESYDTAQDYPT